MVLIPCIKSASFLLLFAPLSVCDSTGEQRSNKLGRSKLPPIDATNSAVYESLDAQFNDIPLDYTYPTPSPTSKQDHGSESTYAYIPHNGSSVPSVNGKLETTAANGNQHNIYHSIGPDVVQHYEFDSNGGATGSSVIHKAAAVSGPTSIINSSHYQNTSDEFGGQSVVYEDPTLPRFRVSVYTTWDCEWLP